MRIAMVASEAAPFVKTGGLGDVMQALPNALSKLKGNEICLFLPYYKRIKENPAVETEQVGSFSMELAWRELCRYPASEAPPQEAAGLLHRQRLLFRRAQHRLRRFRRR